MRLRQPRRSCVTLGSVSPPSCLLSLPATATYEGTSCYCRAGEAAEAKPSDVHYTYRLNEPETRFGVGRCFNRWLLKVNLWSSSSKVKCLAVDNEFRRYIYYTVVDMLLSSSALNFCAGERLLRFSEHVFGSVTVIVLRCRPWMCGRLIGFVGAPSTRTSTIKIQSARASQRGCG